MAKRYDRPLPPRSPNRVRRLRSAVFACLESVSHYIADVASLSSARVATSRNKRCAR
jgi:hypothetical protein